MRFEFKLGEEDAAKYPDGEKWFTFDPEVLNRKTARELMKLEVALDGNTLTQIVTSLHRGGALGVLGGMFVARRLAGVNERWENFDPQIYAADIKFDDEDAQLEQAEGLAADPTGPVTAPSPTTSPASTPTSSTKRTSPRSKSEA